MSTGPGAQLLERGPELSELGEIASAAAAGGGTIVLIEGEAGIGKSSLLRALAAACTAGGAHVLTARGAELERDFAHGVTRQLYEPVLRACDEQRRERLLSGAARLAAGALGIAEPTGSADGAHAAASHGLYWLTVALAEEQALVLVIDDAHWADVASLRFVHYAARRLEALPVLVALALREAEPGAPHDLIDSIRDLPAVRRVRPRLLTPNATRELLARSAGEEPHERVVAACQEVTSGNPFFVEELARALPGVGVPANADAVRALGPQSIARAVLGRLDALWPEALALARAVAVLDADAEPRHAAAVAELNRGAADAAADALVAADVLAPGRPLRFVHPIVRQAVYGQIPEHRRGALHRAAAAALHSGSPDPDRAAVHLLATEPAGDRAAADRLVLASSRALARGAPATAVRFGRRALAEPPDPGRRAETLIALGRAERYAGDPQAVITLNSAVAEASDIEGRVEAVRELAAALAVYGDAERAAAVLDEAARELPADAREQRLTLEAEYFAVTALTDSLARDAAERLERILPGVRGETPAERILLAAASHHRLFSSAPDAERTIDLARRAASGTGLVAEHGATSTYWIGPAMALIFTDRHEDADAIISAAERDARRRGSPAGATAAGLTRARLDLVAGRMAAALSEAKLALELAADVGPAYREHALGTITYALLEQGRCTDAWELLEAERLATATLGPTASSHTLLFARAALRRELGDVEGALIDTDDSLAREQERGGVFPRPLASGSRALTLRAAGELRRARAEAARDLEAARAWGVRSAEGAALLVLALVCPEDGQLPRLAQAVDLLAEGPRRLDHARAAVELGAALRRANRRADAREPLSVGMDLAHRCGATLLAERAREELAATGARPRRLVVSGVESLTPSELRVARLAADGLSNPQIAQELFVTRRTVETHLAHVYQKLNLKSRTQLGAALASQ